MMGSGSSSPQANIHTDSQSNKRSTSHVTKPNIHRRPKSADHKTFEEEALKIHNEYRHIHEAPPLKLSDPLSNHAQRWADYIANKDMMLHGKCTLAGGDTVGENIYSCWGPAGASMNDRVTARAAVRAWYNESEHYDFKEGKYSIKTAHFTQLVWKGTRELGIAKSVSSEGSVYILANYRPVGNVLGEFKENVMPIFEDDFQGNDSSQEERAHSSESDDGGTDQN